MIVKAGELWPTSARAPASWASCVQAWCKRQLTSMKGPTSPTLRATAAPQPADQLPHGKNPFDRCCHPRPRQRGGLGDARSTMRSRKTWSKLGRRPCPVSSHGILTPRAVEQLRVSGNRQALPVPTCRPGVRCGFGLNFAPAKTMTLNNIYVRLFKPQRSPGQRRRSAVLG